MYYICY